MHFVCGFDEAGRGPLAGPVAAAAVILPEDFPVELLNDSKKLSPKKRAACEQIIKEKACYGIALIEHDEIDKINILNASLKAMKLAYEKMIVQFPQWCQKNNYQMVSDVKEIEGIADGNFSPDVEINIRSEIKADAKFPCVMAASILAKECRDRIMDEYDKLYPQYGYAKHKGYPTPAHKKICAELGPSPIQRLSFNYLPKK